MKSDGKDSPPWLRLSGIGIEFAAAVAGFTLIGYWVDRHWGCSPWGLLVGLLLGLVGGFYNMTRESFGAAAQAHREWEDRERQSAAREDDRPG